MTEDNRSGSRSTGAWKTVADQLRRDIIFGHLQPREHLVEDDVMAKTGASRHAVRRAFEQMEQVGLVQRQPNKGVRVRSYSAQQVDEIYVVRETLESKAARLISLPASAGLIERLTAIQAEHEAASMSGDVVLLFETNKLFHETLYSACGNAVLLDAIRRYTGLSHLIQMRLMSDRAWRAEAVCQHRRMIALLEAQDNDRLEALCLAHLQPPRRYYLSLYGLPQDPPSGRVALSSGHLDLQ